ncbi:MAG: translational GTPase TypA, partial [Elusimicrobiota bacterium]
HLVVDVDAAYQGAVLECLGRRGGQMVNLTPEGTTRVRFEYTIASRRLMGFKTELMTLTKGTGMMHHSFFGYGPRGADPEKRSNGVLIAMEKGTTTAYALYSLQERCTMLVGAVVEVYEGMLVGINPRFEDMVVNPCKQKAMSNMRTKATDEALTLSPHLTFTLEQSLEFIDETEVVEVTPKSIRLRKKVLDATERKRALKQER